MAHTAADELSQRGVNSDVLSFEKDQNEHRIDNHSKSVGG